MKATLKQYRQSPRKVRLVADVIRGKKVERALTELEFLNKRASSVIKKLVDSAVAGAKHDFNTEKSDLFVKEVTVNKGPILHRWIPRARGRATPINKRTSHITVVLGEDKKAESPVVEKTKKETKPKKETNKKD